MRASCRLYSAIGLAIVAGFLPLGAQAAHPRPQAQVHPDHHEFEAMLFAPFNGAFPPLPEPPLSEKKITCVSFSTPVPRNAASNSPMASSMQVTAP